jgi:hypothetical protein
LEKCDTSRACIEALMVRPPGLQGAAGDGQDLRRLTLREARRLQMAILLKQTRTFDAMPALVTILGASVRILDYCAHSDLATLRLDLHEAKDGEVACWLQYGVVSNHGWAGVLSNIKWPTP